MRRALIVGASVIAVAIAAALYVLLTSLDRIIEAAIETYGSEITGVEVRLDGVEVRLIDGQGYLRGFRVGNPSGFKAKHAFSAGEITLALDVGTITAGPIVVKEIVVDRPALTYEIGPRGSNIDVIRRQVEANTEPATTGSKSAAAATGPMLVIDDLYIRGGTVEVATTAFRDQKLRARLPDIHLEDIGKKKGGTSPGRVAQAIVTSVVAAIRSSVGTRSLDEAFRALGQQMKPSARQSNAGSAGPAGGSEGTAEAARKAIDQATGRLKKLFR